MVAWLNERDTSHILPPPATAACGGRPLQVAGLDIARNDLFV